MKDGLCPQCRNPLERVRQSDYSALNRDQFDSVKAGDYYCSTCRDNSRGQSALCYWWDHELRDAIDYSI